MTKKKKPVGIAIPGRMTKKKKPKTGSSMDKIRQRATSGGSGMAAGIAKARKKAATKYPEAGKRAAARSKPKAKPRKNSPGAKALGSIPIPKRRS
tara:strand:- start:68 stop:352 length:285 start_codon:yes stop_codon:yes gene_type:complete